MKTMNDLVIIEEDRVFTTSEQIASGTGQTHQSVLKLLTKHESRFSKYQRVGFEIQPFETRGGQQVRRVAILDERQAYLLMTMLRNTERVLDFKEALVDAFMDAKQLLATSQMGLLQVQAILYAKRDSEKEAASAYGKGLSDWKRKRDALDDAIFKVERQIQPQLTNFE